ncbi:MAG: DNA repair protein RadC [Spirochaetaceae bacterium]|nr:DNA repair protein RadC [Spirochaetaceae bacterium]
MERPHYHGHRQRLRKRFLKSGLAGFGEHEIVELLLTLAIPRGDAKPAAKELVNRFGNVRGVLDAPLSELRSVAGVGEIAESASHVIRAAATFYLQQTSEARELLADPQRRHDFWRMWIGGMQHEVFGVAYLVSANAVLTDGVEILQERTVDRAAVYPRRVVEAALRRQAAAIVLAHNHPGGKLEPSEHDKLVTRAVVLAAETIGLRVVDHLIVSPDDAFSFRNAGLL